MLTVSGAGAERCGVVVIAVAAAAAVIVPIYVSRRHLYCY